jgi:hypothetical protein
MQAIADFGGIVPASALPYRGSGTGCAAAEKLRHLVVTSVSSSAFYEIRRDESAMVSQLMETTLSVALSASGTFQSYVGGVIRATSGCPSRINHAVQAVGYNKQGNYYIVRNSWGSRWGDGGFVYIEAGANVCGIGAYGVYSSVIAFTPKAPPTPLSPPALPPSPPSPPHPPPPPMHPDGPVPDAAIAVLGPIPLLGGELPTPNFGPVTLGGHGGLTIAAWVQRVDEDMEDIALLHCSNGFADTIRLSFANVLTFATGPAAWDKVAVEAGASIPPWEWTHIMVTQSFTNDGGAVLLYINNVVVGSGVVLHPHNTSRTDCHLGRGDGEHANDPRFRGVVRDLYVANYPIGQVARHFLYDQGRVPGGSAPQTAPHAVCDLPGRFLCYTPIEPATTQKKRLCWQRETAAYRAPARLYRK